MEMMLDKLQIQVLFLFYFFYFLPSSSKWVLKQQQPQQGTGLSNCQRKCSGEGSLHSTGEPWRGEA